MSIKQIIFTKLILILTLMSCNEKHTELNKETSVLNSEDKKELALKLHKMSDAFLQSSHLHRAFKDSSLFIDPTNVDVRQRLSYSYKKVGEHIKAMEILNEAARRDTAQRRTDVLEYRAWTLLYYYRDYEGTIRDVDLIENMTNSKYNVCWGEPCGFQKGQALYRLGKYKEAINTLETVNVEEQKLGFDIKDNYLIFFYIGRSYAELKEYNKAIHNYRKAINTKNKLPEIYYQLGLCYKMLNHKKKALENFKLAKKYINNPFNEPYIERFDEIFPYMVEEQLETM